MNIKLLKWTQRQLSSIVKHKPTSLVQIPLFIQQENKLTFFSSLFLPLCHSDEQNFCFVFVCWLECSDQRSSTSCQIVAIGPSTRKRNSVVTFLWKCWSLYSQKRTQSHDWLGNFLTQSQSHSSFFLSCSIQINLSVTLFTSRFDCDIVLCLDL